MSIRQAAILLVLLVICQDVSAYNLYYASPSGNRLNSGTDRAHPLPLDYSLNTYDLPDTIVILLNGTYNANGQNYSPLGMLQFHSPTLRNSGSYGHEFIVQADNKWMAIIMGGTVSGIGAATSAGYQTPYVIFDGLQVCSNSVDGLSVCSNSIVQNCWIHDNTQQGINSSAPYCRSNIFQYNLLERNGADNTYLYHYHNIYVYGDGNIYRYNVSRWVGGGHDVQFYTENNSIYPGINNQIYGNLIYGLQLPDAGYVMDVWNGLVNINPANGAITSISPTGTNYVYGNIIIGSILPVAGVLCMTNNVLIATGGQPFITGSSFPPTIRSGGNFSTNAISGVQSTVVSYSQLGLKDMAKGQPWLTAGSILRGNAITVFVPPQDWFKNNRTDSDVGPNPYSATLAADTRVLETQSGTQGGDYWTLPALCILPSILTQPTNQTATAGANVTWQIAATGTGPLHYYWTWNGSPDGTDSPTFVSPNVLLTDSGAHVQCLVSNQCGTTLSSIATLTVVLVGNGPVITKQPANQTVNVNQNATYTISATGDAVLHYYWKFNNIPVGTDSSTYTRVSCQMIDGGNIATCLVSNQVSSVLSSAATLVVNNPPPIPINAGINLVGTNGITLDRNTGISIGK